MAKGDDLIELGHKILRARAEFNEAVLQDDFTAITKAKLHLNVRASLAKRILRAN